MPGEVVASDGSSNSRSFGEKIMRLTPSDGGVVSFRVEASDGATTDSITSDDGKQALQVDIQLGEFEVIREIMRSSIPLLVGWTTQATIAVQKNVDDAVNQAGGGYGSPEGAGSRVPF